MKRPHPRVLTLLSVALLATTSALAQEADIQALEAGAEQYMTAFAAGDAEAIAQLYTDNAIFINALGQVHEGQQAVTDYFQASFQQSPVHFAIEPQESFVDHDLGYQLGSFTVTTPEGEMVVQGYYLLTFNRVDGEWKIHRHLTNMILPEQLMPEQGNDGM